MDIRCELTTMKSAGIGSWWLKRDLCLFNLFHHRKINNCFSNKITHRYCLFIVFWRDMRKEGHYWNEILIDSSKDADQSRGVVKKKKNWNFRFALISDILILCSALIENSNFSRLEWSHSSKVQCLHTTFNN